MVRTTNSFLRRAGLQAGLNDLPHSRQRASWRGVMSPQEGHIRCEAKSPSWGSIFRNFLKEAARKARRLRMRGRNGCDMDVMDKTHHSLTSPKVSHSGVRF